ncbi:hypothetical protein T03_12073 [Trichinella britovi]|nr:hypothetical protein T03_12073 [Trichinella britovi]
MPTSPEKLPTVQKYSSGHAVQMSSGRDRSNLYAKVKLAAGAAANAEEKLPAAVAAIV